MQDSRIASKGDPVFLFLKMQFACEGGDMKEILLILAVITGFLGILAYGVSPAYAGSVVSRPWLE